MTEHPDHPDLNPDDVREILFDVASDVLEQYAFMFLTPVDSSEIPIRGHQFMHALIRFSGPFAGSLSFYATPSFCALLASNVLGMEPEELTAEHTDDALKELANVTCGELLVALAGKTAIFDLTVPQLERVSATDCKAALTQPDAIAVMVDEEPLIISSDLHNT